MFFFIYWLKLSLMDQEAEYVYDTQEYFIVSGQPGNVQDPDLSKRTSPLLKHIATSLFKDLLPCW